MGEKIVPERDDDELCVLGSVLDVIRNDRYVPEIQRGINLVHKVQRCGLDVRNRFRSESEAAVFVHLTL